MVYSIWNNSGQIPKDASFSFSYRITTPVYKAPNVPDGLFERIEKEAEDTCIYKRIFMDYTYGIGKIYTQEEIDKAR